ncbi:hypothetical protein BDQ12DRAFT_325007 [Crucibulum laeve]|uniref:Uncharacterized protein n=1 Tax=Crucibulum laeve TaxID=68775 RepID=A0A5C3LQK3_9AGAR|nr:hypothetical protein BDQ12DRAFT_325007 [Crucibulum laeve]
MQKSGIANTSANRRNPFVNRSSGVVAFANAPQLTNTCGIGWGSTSKVILPILVRPVTAITITCAIELDIQPLVLPTSTDAIDPTVTIRLLNHPVRKRSLFPASRSRRHPASPPHSVISHSFITFIPLR